MKDKKVRTAVVAIVALMVILVGWWQRERLEAILFAPNDSSLPQGQLQSQDAPEVVTTNLQTPWEIVKLPNDDLLVTERRGQLVRIGEDNQKIRIKGVMETSEGGLMGLALHPEFERNKYIYLALTTDSDDGPVNQVVRYKLEGDAVNEREIILDAIPASQVHDGGRIAFGPDKKLYVTTGDAGRENEAQDKGSLAGKILRLNNDGTFPSDNPFDNAVWSYGHRNPQGLAWDNEGRLWSSEHGPSGYETGNDEINLIEKGANYGWPLIVGEQKREGMRTPVATSGDAETWAPAGLAYADGALYFAGLRGASLYKATIKSDDDLALKTYFRQEYGRLRAVLTDNESLFISTSNRDGRGTRGEKDDQILKVSIGSLK